MSRSSSLCLPGTSTPPASHTGGAVVYFQRAGDTTPPRTSLFGAVSAVCRRLALCGFTTALETCGDSLGLRATATRAPTTLLVGIVGRLDTTVGAVRRLLTFVLVGAHRRREPRLGDGIGDRPGDQLDRANRVIVAGDRHGDQIGIGVGVDDTDDRNPELVRLVDGDLLLLRVDHEQKPGQTRHVADTGEILLQLLALAREEELFLLGVVLELAAFLATLLQLLHPTDLLLDGLEVREQAAEPALGDMHGVAAIGLLLHDRLELALRADEQNVVTPHDDVAHELLRKLELTQRLLQVDDVDAVALGEDEPAHLGVPPARLMAEVNARFEELLQRWLHANRCPSRVSPPPLSASLATGEPAPAATRKACGL